MEDLEIEKNDQRKMVDLEFEKNDQHKMVNLEFEKNDPPYPSMNILIFDYNKLKLEDDMKINYDEKPCKIYLKTVCANVIKGYHPKRNTYLQIM